MSTGFTMTAGVVILAPVVANAAAVGAADIVGLIRPPGEFDGLRSRRSGVERGSAVVELAGVSLGAGLFVSEAGVGMLPGVGGPILLGAMASDSLKVEIGI